MKQCFFCNTLYLGLAHGDRPAGPGGGSVQWAGEEGGCVGDGSALEPVTTRNIDF